MLRAFLPALFPAALPVLAEAPAIEVVSRRPAAARVLDEIFLSLWNGPYARKLDPDMEHQAPKIN